MNMFMSMIAYRFMQTTPLLIDFIKGTADNVVDSILNILFKFLGFVLYVISIGLCKVVEFLYTFFEVFGGLTKVQYKGESKYLINVFFDQSVVTDAYWFMALIAFVLLFAFVIAAVIRKLFDTNEKQKESYGQIIMSAGKAILVILLMNGIITVSLSATNILMQQINYIFDISGNVSAVAGRNFTDQELAAMNNIFETIGNYSLNPSASSRYNINSCFNDIREDMYYLQKQGVFDYDYTSAITIGWEYGYPIKKEVWQTVLQDIAKTTDLRSDVKMDVYHAEMSQALEKAMEILRTNNDFRPLAYISGTSYLDKPADLDVVLFLTGTSNAALNAAYNDNPSVGDAIRGPFYSGSKSIYLITDVTESFNISAIKMNYFVIIGLCFLMGWQLITCVVTCASRVFNLLVLYIIAPPFAATIPFDEGSRFKQWTQAFVVQCVNVFGTVIIMRLLIIFIPIILDYDLKLFDNRILNLIGKAVFIYAGLVAAAKGSDLFAGILTGSGASASAGSTAAAVSAGSALGKTFDKGLADATGLTYAKNKAAKKWEKFKKSGGIVGKALGWEDDEEKEQAKKEQKENAKHDELLAAMAGVLPDRIQKKLKDSGIDIGALGGKGSGGGIGGISGISGLGGSSGSGGGSAADKKKSKLGTIASAVATVASAVPSAVSKLQSVSSSSGGGLASSVGGHEASSPTNLMNHDDDDEEDLLSNSEDQDQDFEPSAPDDSFMSKAMKDFDDIDDDRLK